MPKKPAIIKSKLLSDFPEIINGMSTKLGGYDNPPYYNNLSFYVGDFRDIVLTNREEFFDKLGIDQKRLAIPQQIQGDNVEIVDKPGTYSDADALITEQEDIYLVVSTADCIPVAVYDRSKQVIANIHSGWRGTEKKIVAKTINKMMTKFGCKPKDMVVFIGPGITRRSFEVGQEVAELFDTKYVEKINGRCYVDILANVIDQLVDAGIDKSNIECSELCTFEEEDYLHSFRRDKTKSGRMFGVIGMKPQ
jgi:YfiH family protein